MPVRWRVHRRRSSRQQKRIPKRPTVQLASLSGGLAELHLAMTTNGALLAHKASALAEAGLKRLNVSLYALAGDGGPTTLPHNPHKT